MSVEWSQNTQELYPGNESEEIAALKAEIIRQRETIRLAEEAFVKSRTTVEEQNQKLSELNKELKVSLKNKTDQLGTTNEELIKHNNELLQFSFTVSHNLRGPVARLLGLTNLMDMGGGSPEIYDRIKVSAHELESVLRDLSKIIDIRNDIYRIREKVYFADEWQKIRENLIPELDKRDRIDSDFVDAPWIVSIRPLVASILYNLVSNAIKYRSYDKALRINIETIRENGEVKLCVSDNGLGIDLDKHRNQIFKLYQRFHVHKEGKGMGLYLVKTQAEILGGRVDVKSKPNGGSEFIVHFKIGNEREPQLCMTGPYATIFYHAWLSTLEFRWHGAPSIADLDAVFEKGKEVMRNYKALYFISDVRYRSDVTREEQAFAVTNIIPPIFEAGIIKIFFVQHAHKIPKTNPNVLNMLASDPRYEIVSSFEEAKEKIEEAL